MRCQACNRLLTNSEATRKFASGVFTDLCNKCLGTIEEDVSLQEDEYNEEEDDTQNM